MKEPGFEKYGSVEESTLEVAQPSLQNAKSTFYKIHFPFLILVLSFIAIVGWKAVQTSSKHTSNPANLASLEVDVDDEQSVTQFESCMKDADVLDCCVNPANPVLGGVDIISTSMLPDQGLIYGIQDHSFTLKTSFGAFQFWFSTETSQNIFASDPWFFAPALGGFDTAQFCDNIQVSPAKGLGATGPFWDIPDTGGNLWWYSSVKDKDTLPTRTDMSECLSFWDDAFGKNDGFFNTDCFMSKKQVALHKKMKNTAVNSAPESKAEMVPLSPTDLELTGDDSKKGFHYVHGIEERVYNQIIETIRTHGDLTTNLGREPTYEEFQLYKRQVKTASDEESQEVHHVKDLSDSVYKAAYLSITTGADLNSMIGREPTDEESRAINRIRNMIAEGTWRYDENGHLMGSITAKKTLEWYHP